MADAGAPGNGAETPQPPSLAQQQAPTLSPEDADRITNELSSITFEIEKKLSVPNNSGGNEEAYMAEDKNKVATYNLVIKIDKTPIQAGTGPTATQQFLENIKKALVDMNNYEFSLSSIGEIAYLPITYSYTMNETETKETIYVYHIKEATIFPIKRVSNETYNVENIFAIQATRQKTNAREQLKEASGLFTPQQQQELIPLEETIMTALKALVGYTDTGLNDTIKTNLITLKGTWGTFKRTTETFGQKNIEDAKNALFALFSQFTLPSSFDINNINTDPLVKNLTRYRTLLGSKGATAFKLNFTPGTYRGQYETIKDLIYNIAGALRQPNIKAKVVSSIRALTDEPTKTKYNTLIAYIPAINDAFSTEAFGALLATKTGNVFQNILRPFHRAKTNPAFYQQPVSTVQIQTAPQTTNGGSIKYQQKRYKVHERDDGAKYITLDKKNYTLKTSSKGTYITRDGKRQYL